MTRPLDAIRADIDRVDAELIALFETRMQLAREAACRKQIDGQAAADPKREDAIVRARVEGLSDPSLRGAVETLMQTLIALSKEEQKRHLAARVYLTGLMGSGKTSVGRQLAALLGWGFVDTDEAIEAHVGKPIAAIFQEEGEAAFRAIEADMLHAIAMLDMTACVVATGGGAILNRVSAARMRESGLVVALDRPVEAILRDLDARNRPLLAGDPEKLFGLFAAREGVYRERSDLVFSNGYGCAEEAAEALCDVLTRQFKSAIPVLR